MTLVDVILAALLLFFCIRGFKRGFVSEVVETVGVFAAALVSFRLLPTVGGWLGVTEDSSLGKQAAVCIGLFILIMIVITLIARLVQKFLETIHLGQLDHLLGGVIGLIKGGLMIAAVCWAIAWTSKNGRAMVESSPVAKVDLYVYQWISHFLPDGWEERVRKVI